MVRSQAKGCSLMAQTLQYSIRHRAYQRSTWLTSRTAPVSALVVMAA